MLPAACCLLPAACSSIVQIPDYGAGHRFHADRHAVFVDVEAWMVVTPDESLILILGADEEETAWPFLPEVVALLGGHLRIGNVDVLGTDDFLSNFLHQCG